MSDCTYKEKLSDHLDGQLGPAEQEAVRAHLENSPSCGCREEVEELRALVGALADLPDGAAPEGGWRRLERALDGSVSRRRTTQVLAWAASLVLGSLLLGWAFTRLGERIPTELSPQGPGIDAPFPGSGRARPAGSGTDGLRAGRLQNPEIRPQVVAAVRREQLPAVRFDEQQLVGYGTELAALDALIDMARSLPVEPEDREFQEDLRRLTSLRQDLLNEIVLQAQAERTGSWH